MSQTVLDRAGGEAGWGEDKVRKRILDAAATEFQEYGLRRTTVDAVARRAGVGRMTLYRRFAGKDELVEAVVMRDLRAFMVDLEQTMSDRETLAEQLIEGLVFTVLHGREHPLLGRLLDTEPDAVLPYLTVDGRALVDAAVEFTAEHIRRSPEGKGMTPAALHNAAEASTRLGQSLMLTPGGSARSPGVLRAFARQTIPALLDSARR